MNFPTQMDQLIHDHQGARHADARAHRLARAARRARRNRRSPLPVRVRRRSDATELLMQLGAEVELLAAAPTDRRTERVAAGLLVSATVTLEAPARSVGLEPLLAGTPIVVSSRWLARLAERTAGTGPALDAARTAELSAIIAELRSLPGSRAAPAEAATGAAVAAATRVGARRPAPVRLSVG